MTAATLRGALLGVTLTLVASTASACLSQDNGGVINGPPATTSTTTAPLGTPPKS